MKKLKINLNIGFGSLAIGARNPVMTKYLGRYRSAFKGTGLEFDSYRRYGPSDDASQIDWKASARSNNLMVKEYIEERNLDVFFLIDVSNTMLLSSQPKLKCEYAAELVASLSYHILQSDDTVGYALFSDEVVDFRPPAKGPTTHAQLIETLSNANNYGGAYDINTAFKSAMELLAEGSLMIIVSDFIGLENGWEEIIKIAASKFSLIGIMIRDPIDRKIPTGLGQVAIADPLSNDNILVDPNIIKPYYEQEVQRQEKEVENTFRNNGADFTILQTDGDFVEGLSELFKLREERWR